FGEWDRVAFDITPSIDPTATEIQVALGVIDIGADFCQSHAPLIDNVVFYATGVVPTGVRDPELPSAVVLHQNHPNPFNPTTRIRFEIPEPGAAVSLRIYDVRGRLVQVLRQRFFGPGLHTVKWDGTNRRGGHVGSGVYFYRLETPGFTDTRKMVLLE
ncbi:MAG: T9SS type A sorting domain-containing protein, partial [Gammaproteobacteria bacterium]|nr:T9SS type A sorting domain-containing protein [Gammaproteobacteria bacterium]